MGFEPTTIRDLAEPSHEAYQRFNQPPSKVLQEILEMQNSDFFLDDIISAFNISCNTRAHFGWCLIYLAPHDAVMSL